MYELQEAPIGKESRSKEEAETPGLAGQAGTREQWLLVAAGWVKRWHEGQIAHGTESTLIGVYQFSQGIYIIIISGGHCGGRG